MAVSIDLLSFASCLRITDTTASDQLTGAAIFYSYERQVNSVSNPVLAEARSDHGKSPQVACHSFLAVFFSGNARLRQTHLVRGSSDCLDEAQPASAHSIRRRKPMKICPTCHLVYKDRFVFCTRDGTLLDASMRTNPSTPRSIPQSGNGADSDRIETAGTSLRVMRCPACAMEYPLTFTSCPSDGMRLSEKKPQPACVASLASLSIPDEQNLPEEFPTTELEDRNILYGRHSVPAPHFAISTSGEQGHSPAQEAVILPVIEDDEPELEESQPAGEESIYPIEPQHEPSASTESRAETQPSNSFEDYYSQPRPGYDTSPLGGSRPSSEPRSVQVAAKAIVSSLTTIAALALYLVYNAGSQSPSTDAATQQDYYVAQAPVFIPTPEEARNYSDESRSEAHKETDDRKSENRLSDSDSSIARTNPSPVQPSARQSQPVTKSDVRAPREVETGPVLAHSTANRITSRLVSVRKNRILSGVRYNLTFALQEQTGRMIKWNSLLISTRSARGVNQSQTVPFYHRQGAAGSLTFTVSIEMKGATETDWRGRVICTTLGADDRGRPMQAQFGAMVAP